MRPSENGKILEGAQEMHYAMCAAETIGEEATLAYLIGVERAVDEAMIAKALDDVTESEVEVLAKMAIALNEPFARYGDIVMDIAASKVKERRLAAQYPIENPHAAIVVEGLVVLQNVSLLGRFFKQVRSDRVKEMLDA